MGWGDIEREENYLSASQIGMYQRCGLQYKFRYIDKKKRPPNSKMFVGSSVHKSIEHNYGNKFLKKKAANKNEVLDVYNDYFKENKTGVDFEGNNVGQVKDRGYRMATVHYDRVAPSVQPVAKPELRLTVPLPFTKKVMLAYYDVVANIGKLKGIILDNKTTSRAWKQWDTDLNLQFTNYAYVAAKLKKPIGGLAVDVIIEKKGGISTQRLFTERSVPDLVRYEKNIAMVSKAIDQGLFVPTNNPQTCHWCGYRDICWASAVKKENKVRGVLV